MQDLGSAAARQHEVEHDEVDTLSEGQGKSALAVHGRVDLEAIRTQSTVDEVDDPGLVLDQDDVGHGCHSTSPIWRVNPGKESSHPEVNRYLSAPARLL